MPRKQHRRATWEIKPRQYIPPKPPAPPPQKDFFDELTERLERIKLIKEKYLEWKRKKQEIYLAKVKVEEMRQRSLEKKKRMEEQRKAAALELKEVKEVKPTPLDITTHPSWRSFSRRAQQYALSQAPWMEMPDRVEMEKKSRGVKIDPPVSTAEVEQKECQINTLSP